MQPTGPSEIPRTIVRLEVDSFQRLRAARVLPSPTGLVEIAGRNGQGKSSLIESMLDALGAEKSDMPIQSGQDGATVVMQLGDDLIVRKRWSRDAAGQPKASLTVESATGGKFSSPAAVLKALCGRFADPVAFLDMSPTEQVKTVLAVLGLDEKLRELERVAADLYDRRRDLGREVDRSAKAAAEVAREVESLTDAPTGAPLPELMSHLQAANKANADHAAATTRLREVGEQGKASTARIAALKLQLQEEEAKLVKVTEEWQKVSAWLKDRTLVDTADLVSRINAHEEAAKSQSKRDLAAKLSEAARVAAEAHVQSEHDLEAARGAILDLLGSAKFPVDGMTYDPDSKSLLVNGIPFSQASQAERLSAAASVAMAGSPSLRVLFAREGSLLDHSSRAQLADLAERSGFQLWMEVVADAPTGAGIWIEDGEIGGGSTNGVEGQ